MSVRLIPHALLRWVLALIGFTAIVAQIVLVRELVVVFHGNEMSLGLILACWLLWTAIGSGLLGKAAARARSPGTMMAVLQATLALVLPLAIVTVRAAGGAFGVATGEILGPGPMLLASNVALGVVCLVSGSLFAAGSRLYARSLGRSTAAATGAVYVLEALGATAGGAIASLLLIRYLDSVEIALALSLLNLASAAALAVSGRWRRAAAIAALVGIFAFVVFPLGAPALESASLRYMWRGFDLLDSESTIYGNLAVLAAGDTRTVYVNGVPMVTAGDVQSAEEAVHYALLEHPAPKRLLLLGGGIGGALAEALKHPSLEHAVYVELDPAILDLGRSYFSQTWSAVAADPRVVTHHTDGRLFLSRTTEHFDVIIVNLPDPTTAQLNRFYTREFFEEAARHLTPGGVLAVRVTGAENYIGAELARLLRCINKTLQGVFDEVVAVPGTTIHFFAADENGALTSDPGVLVERLGLCHIETQYVRDYYIAFNMSPDRMADLSAQIEPRPDTPVNRDLAPAAYYFDMLLWSTRFHGPFQRAIETLGRVRFAGVLLALWLAAAVYAALALWRARGRRRLRAGAAGCVAAMGFTMIGIEVMILLAFQSVYGYVYQQLALLIAAFMVGMMLGSAASLRRFSGDDPASPARRDVVTLLGVQAAGVCLAPALYALIARLSGVSDPAVVFATGNVLFPLLAALSGAVGGYQFPLATRVYFGAPGDSRAGPGAVYAIDLVGACVGAAAIGAYLIPVFGFLRTALVLASVNVAPALVVALSLGRAGEREAGA
jgi:spermidine synthase